MLLSIWYYYTVECVCLFVAATPACVGSKSTTKTWSTSFRCTDRFLPLLPSPCSVLPHAFLASPATHDST